jgi:hypothetical protein
MAQESIRLIAALTAAAGLSACGTVGLPSSVADSGGSSRETGELLPLRIESMSPNWAPLAGGTEVTVSGAGFEGDVAFWFGGSEMSLTVVDEETLVVVTPEVFVEALVDVKVESDLGSVTLTDGFEFTDTEPEDSGQDTGDSSDPDPGEPTGLIGGMVEFDYIVVGCPSCFGFTDYLDVSATGVFHDGASGSWTDWIPPNGSCVLNPDRTPPVSVTDDVGEHVYLESGSAVSIDLQRSTAGGSIEYASSGLGQDDYVKNASYDLVVADAGSTVEDLVLTTSGFDTIQPTNILNDSASAFPNFSASSAQFSWSPTGVAQSFVVNFQIFDSSGAALLGDVVCAGDDSGSMIIPSSTLSAFPPGSLMAIYFYRWSLQEQVDLVSGDTIQGLSVFGGLGTGTLRP